MEVKYVVSKKSSRGTRPKGTKGPYKLVDKRLKKDKSNNKLKNKNKNKKK